MSNDNTWTPTCELRVYVTRIRADVSNYDKVLQQKFIKKQDCIDGGTIPLSEWRDVEHVENTED